MSIPSPNIDQFLGARTLGTGGLMFYWWCFFLAFCGAIFPSGLGRLPWNFQTWLKMWALRQLSKIGGGAFPNIGGNCFFALRPQISEHPRPIAVKLCQIMGNRLGSKICVHPKKCGEAKVQKLAHNLAYWGG